MAGLAPGFFIRPRLKFAIGPRIDAKNCAPTAKTDIITLDLAEIITIFDARSSKRPP
jgi:hypothetical protein